MPLYKVKPGFSHAGKKPGELIELTEAEASGFLDKLQLVQKDDSTPSISPEIKEQEESPFKNELGVEIDDDLKFLPKKKKKRATTKDD